VRRPSRRLGPGWNAAFFLATVVSVYFAGAGPLSWGTREAGVRLVVGLLSILFAHEMGHYLACRYYRVDATLPFFLPSPWYHTPIGWLPLSFIGTFGAVIRIRSPFPHRRALFDIGIAGPFAGFLVALPVLVLGILEAQVVPLRPIGADNIVFGEPLLFRWVAAALRPDMGPGMTLAIGPLGQAAWFGLFVTALNLMPIGQLDGGHVSYAVFRGRALWISRAAFAVALVLLVQRPVWLFWTLLLGILGRRHPPTLFDERPLGRTRQVVAVVGLLVFAVCFTPDPVLFTWEQFWLMLQELLPA
jgi:membrane-associated protease RseP (regulator of RpoE activity)